MANLLSYLKYNKCALNIQDSLWSTVRARTQSIFTRRLAEGITCGILAFPEHRAFLVDMKLPRKNTSVEYRLVTIQQRMWLVIPLEFCTYQMKSFSCMVS